MEMRMKKVMSAVLAICMLVSLMATGVYATDSATASVTMNNESYDSLQAALAAATTAGDYEIKLSGEIDEAVSFKQLKGVNIVIDGQKLTTYTGTITFNGSSLEDGKLTIKNIAFKNTETKCDFISAVDTNYYPSDMLITDCSFEGTGNDDTVAVRLKSGKNNTIENCTGKGLHSFLQNTAGWNLTIDNVDVTDSKSGFALGTVQGVTVKNCDIDVRNYGVRIDANTYNNAAVIEDCNVEAYIPVVVRDVNTTSNITFNGTNTMTATNDDGIWCAIGVDEYEQGVAAPTEPTDVKVTINDVTLDKSGVVGEYKVVIASQEELNAAVASAAPGDTVTITGSGTYKLPSLSKNITIAAEEGVDATFDMTNQVSVSATVTFDNIIFDYYPNKDYVGLIDNGNLTYNNCTFNGQVFLYGNNEIFNSCDFNQNDANAYNVWTYAANNVEFNECTFNCEGKSVLVYNEGDGPTDLSVVDTEFIANNPVNGKAAIEIDTSLMPEGTEIVVDDETAATGFATGSVSGSTLWNDKKASSDGTVSGGTSSTVIVADEVVKYAKPTGKISVAYTKEVDGYVRIYGEGETITAHKSYVLKLYSGSELVATTELNNVGGIIDGEVYVTWNFFYPSSNDPYWTTTWEYGHPRSTAQPDRIVLLADGIETSSNVVVMNTPDNIQSFVWAELGGVEFYPTSLSGTGTEEDPYLINNIKDLKLFRDMVDDVKSDRSNTFLGKYVKLTADIDLATDVDAEGNQISWNPIGNNKDHGSFLGNFDGDGHTIKNLYIYEENAGTLGFFARTGNWSEEGKPAIKNLNFENIDVSTSVTNHWTTGHGDEVAGVVANCGGNTTIDNVKVSGDVYIAGCARVGGIVGTGYPKMSNCSLETNSGSYIHSGYWQVGGFIGQAGEGSSISDCYVDGNVDGGAKNLSIWGAYGGAAAIAGYAGTNETGTQFCTLSNISAKNVDITGDDYCLGFIAGNGETASMNNVTAENVSVDGNAADALAEVDGKLYFNISDALNAVDEDGDVVTLMCDVDVSTAEAYAVAYTKPYDVTIDLNGKTISGKAAKRVLGIDISGVDEVSLAAIGETVTVTVKNGTIDAPVETYSAIGAAGKSEDMKLIVNVEDVTITNCNDYGFAIRADAYAEVNVKSGTEIISTDGQGGVYAADGAVANVYSGAKITQKDSTTTYMGANLGVSGTGVVNVYGGTFKSDKYNADVMSSGGTLNIYDGTFKSDMRSISVDSWDEITAPSVANVYGGSFTAPTVVWVGTYDVDGCSATANLYGGIFNGTLDETYGGEGSNINAFGGVYNEDPTAFIATTGYKAHTSNSGMWVVAPEFEVEAEASKASVQAGEEFTVSIIVNGGDYTNAGWKLSYDATKFKYVSGDNGQTESNYAIVDSVLGTGDGIDSDEFKEGKEIATYTFEALYPAETVTGTFTLSDAYVDNYEMAAWLDKVAAGVINEEVEITNDRTELTVECGDKTLPYNGKAQQGNPAVPNMTAEVTYSKEANGTYTTEIPSFVEAGTHTYYYKVTRPGYTTVADSATLTITPVSLKVGATFNVDPDYDKVTIQAVLSELVDGNFKGTVTVEVDGQSVTFDAADFTYDGDGDAISRESNALTLSRGGVHDVTITYTAATEGDNYVSETGSTTVDADRTSVTAEDLAAIKAALTTTFTYDGTAKEVVVDSTKLPEGWTVTTDGASITNAGETMSTIFAENTAEKYADFTFNVVLAVTPKKIAIVIDNAEKALGQEDPVFTSNIDELLVNADDLGNIEYVREPGEAMGQYHITMNYVPNPNYEVLPITKGILTIGEVADYVVEVADNSLILGREYKADYIAGHRLVLVYTNVDKAYFTYNGEEMYDVSDAGYECYEYDYDAMTETKLGTYTHVYAIVVEAEGVYEASEAHELKYVRNVKFDKDAEKPEKIVYDADFNYTNELDESDFSTVNGIYNVIYRGSSYITRFLKADAHADKRVDNVNDAKLIKDIVLKK